MKATIVLALAIHAASVIAAPVAGTGAQLDKDSIIIKSSGTYKRDAAAALDKDSIIIKSAGGYKRGEDEKRDPADVS